MNRRQFIAAMGAAQLAASSRRASAATTKPPARITRIRLSTLQGRFQKFVAMNAYDKVPKGYTYEHTLIRIETDQGLEGIGAGTYAIANSSYAASLKPLIGANPLDLYRFDQGRIVGRGSVFAELLSKNRHLDGPLYDLAGKLMNRPAWQLIGDSVRERVPVYDGTLYFSDVWFKDRGPKAVVEECEEAVKSGYRGVKIKAGRGDKWMARKAGDDRDIEVVHAVRAAIGPQTLLMVDPNYGYRGQFEAAWRFLWETRDAKLHWMEEIFPETVPDYTRLRQKMTDAGMKTKIAAGEHMRDIRGFDPYLKPARLMDVLQMDIRQGGFLDNQEVARNAASAGAVAILHNWGSQIGTIMGLHLARAVESVPMAESDRSTCDVLVTDEYVFRDGSMEVPSKPGLAIGIDEEVYKAKCIPTEIVVA
jgi:L-alanine-DL-glutamate epimerase-like enolase superfamily enzyme